MKRYILPLYVLGPVKQNYFERKIANIFLSIAFNMCFGCSEEPSHRDGSFEYPQHMFWLRNKKINFQLCTLVWGPDMCMMLLHLHVNLKCYCCC